VPRTLLAVTIVLSVLTKLDPALAELFALQKITNVGGDFLSSSPWRLVTVAFVHGGINPDWQSWALHLGFNAIALDIAAQLVYRLYGAKRLIGWYFIGVVGASLASAIWFPYGYSVGAFGGVFALGSGGAKLDRNDLVIVDETSREEAASSGIGLEVAGDI
jgi:membrane associated rhomboid family serine protease